MAESIMFKAYNGAHSFEAPTAKEAVQGFLERFKSRTLRVIEYRDGKHKTIVHLDGRPNEGMFYRKFNSRMEARAFLVNG